MRFLGRVEGVFKYGYHMEYPSLTAFDSIMYERYLHRDNHICCLDG